MGYLQIMILEDFGPFVLSLTDNIIYCLSLYTTDFLNQLILLLW